MSPSEDRPSILLVGANGRLGTAVAAELAVRGHPFRAGVRKLRARPGETNSVQLDLRRPGTFAAALGGVDQVITAAHGMTARPRDSIARVDIDGHKRLIDAAASAGVRRFVYTSAHGADADHPAPLLRAKAQVERHLAASGIDHVILRPTAFMELYAQQLIGAAVLAGKPVWLLGGGRTKRNLISVRDVAAIAVLALDERSWTNRVLEIGGPDNMTDREIAVFYAGVAGKPARVLSMPLPVVRALATASAPFHAGVGNLLEFMAALDGRDDLVLDASQTAALLGRQPVSLADHVSCHRVRGPAPPRL